MSKSIATLDVVSWVALAPASQQGFREAVHIVLSAIGGSMMLRTQMVMKGGMLMALRYNSSRFTRDADFSTVQRYQQGAEQALTEELEMQIQYFNQALAYTTHCTIQSSAMLPKGSNRTFPTLKLTIGYADQSDTAAMKRLLVKRSSKIVEIDLSYNEAVLDVEILRLSDGDELRAYSLLNLMAEKYRSLLQQPSRNRSRYQDVYDLYILIQRGQLTDPSEHERLRECIERSCMARGIQAERSSLLRPEVQSMAAKGYQTLANDLDEALPEFDDAYRTVRDFYEGLPWSSKKA